MSRPALEDKELAQELKFLLCDPTGIFGEPPFSREEAVSSPIHCLDQAVDGDHGLIVIRFSRMPLSEREILLELAAALKRNSHTRHRPVLALLPEKHRKLLEDLVRAGVDFVKYIDEHPLNSRRMQELVKDLGPEERLDCQLAMVCPFLHYCRLDMLREMEVCGAYLDRMVLGGWRLHGTCETREHLGCEYLLNPRRA